MWMRLGVHGCRLVCPSGIIASYLHASSSPGLGKMGALVAITDSKGALEREKAAKAKVASPDTLYHTYASLLSLCRPKITIMAQAKLLYCDPKAWLNGAGAGSQHSHAHCGNPAAVLGQEDHSHRGFGRQGPLSMLCEVHCWAIGSHLNIDESGACHAYQLRSWGLMHSIYPTAEKRVLTEQAERSGKPANIIERMVAGRLHKVMLANCVLYSCGPRLRM